MNVLVLSLFVAMAVPGALGIDQAKKVGNSPRAQQAFVRESTSNALRVHREQKAAAKAFEEKKADDKTQIDKEQKAAAKAFEEKKADDKTQIEIDKATAMLDVHDMAKAEAAPPAKATLTYTTAIDEYKIYVSDSAGFKAGDVVTIGSGDQQEEATIQRLGMITWAKISRFGAGDHLILSSGLKKPHEEGEPVVDKAAAEWTAQALAIVEAEEAKAAAEAKAVAAAEAKAVAEAATDAKAAAEAKAVAEAEEQAVSEAATDAEVRRWGWGKENTHEANQAKRNHRKEATTQGKNKKKSGKSSEKTWEVKQERDLLVTQAAMEAVGAN